jgi:hypothetical protein
MRIMVFVKAESLISAQHVEQMAFERGGGRDWGTNGVLAVLRYFRFTAMSQPRCNGVGETNERSSQGSSRLATLGFVAQSLWD